MIMPNIWDLITSHIKTAIALVIAGIVLALLLFLDLRGPSLFTRWFSTETVIIEKRSLTRGVVEVFMAGEKIRFALQDVESETVFWLFDEKELYSGGIEYEHAFAFDKNEPDGLEKVHRIDSFFKYNDSYQTTSTMVRVQNSRLVACVEIQGENISVVANKGLSDRWVLQKGWLSKSEGGVFQPKADLMFQPVAGTPEVLTTTVTPEAWSEVLTHPEYLAWSPDGDWITPRTFGLINANRRLWAGVATTRTSNAWLTYEFQNTDGDERLEIVSPLSGTLSEECPPLIQ